MLATDGHCPLRSLSRPLVAACALATGSNLRRSRVPFQSQRHRDITIRHSQDCPGDQQPRVLDMDSFTRTGGKCGCRRHRPSRQCVSQLRRATSGHDTTKRFRDLSPRSAPPVGSQGCCPSAVSPAPCACPLHHRASARPLFAPSRSSSTCRVSFRASPSTNTTRRGKPDGRA